MKFTAAAVGSGKRRAAGMLSGSVKPLETERRELGLAACSGCQAIPIAKITGRLERSKVEPFWKEAPRE
jgi:hypothetical protein